jgi:Tfp pilus assembly protein FimT
MKTIRRTTSSGFSIVELSIVLGIALVVSAMAVPNLISAVSDFKLRSNVSDLSGMMQRARMEAVRQNKIVTIRTATVSGTQEFYADLNNNGAFDAREPRFFIPTNMTVPTTGSPSGLTTASGITTVLTPPIRFNARGLSCVNAACTTPANGSGFVYYFRDTRPLGVNGWAALTVTPAGRVKSWWWTGSAWK